MMTFCPTLKYMTLLSVLGCYVGVTYGAFVPETTIWLDVCSNQNLSICSVFPSDDCNGLRLLDIVVTRNYVLFATSFGLVKSASFALLMSDQSIVEKVTAYDFKVIGVSVTLSAQEINQSGLSQIQSRNFS